MRVVVHPADEHGCGHYRLIWPAAALIAQGHDVRITYDASFPCVYDDQAVGPVIIGLADKKKLLRIGNAWESDFRLRRASGASKLELDRLNARYRREIEEMIDLTGPQQIDADVYVFQRPLHRDRVGLMRALRRAGARVVVEVDDDFHSVHPSNAAWKDSNPLHNAEHNREWLMLACQEADLVTVSTPALAERYGHHGRVQVLPNYVPERYLTIDECSDLLCPCRDGDSCHYQSLPGSPAAKRTPVVGWAGSIDSHPRDLQQTQGAAAEAVLATGAIFRVIGTGKGVQAALGLYDPPEALGWLPLERYPEGLATLDVGIVPLQLSAFNEAKSYLKGLEMAAVGVPFAASPTQQYRHLAGLGIGRIAENSDDWWSLLTSWLRNESLRREVAAEARQAAQELTIERNAYKWMEAWESALKRERVDAVAL